MRNASENPRDIGHTEKAQNGKVMRPTFEAPAELVKEFRRVAKRRNRTMSGHLRQLMTEAIEADRVEAERDTAEREAA